MNTELSVFVQINTEKDIDRWMVPIDCDPRPEYSLEDFTGAYWEIIPEDINYNPAIRAGAKTMSDLFLTDPNAQFIFMWGNPTRLSLESFSSYIAEMGMGWEEYFEDEETYKDVCSIEDDYDETSSTLDDNDYNESDDPLYGYGEDDEFEESKKSKKEKKLAEAAEGDEYEVIAEDYPSKGTIHAKFHATTLANAMKKLAEHLSLYFGADEIVENKDDLMDDEDPEDYFDGEEALAKLENTNGDGCAFITEFKNVTQDKALIVFDNEVENWDD